MNVRGEIKSCPDRFQKRTTSSLLPGTPLPDERKGKVCCSYRNDVKGVERLDYL